MARIAPIRTEADHRAALARIDELMDAEAGTPEADELSVLADLVEIYETKRFPVERPTPLDAIQFRMEQAGLEPRDLEPYIGSRGKVSEVLAGKQPLTLPMIRALHRHLGIPAEVLLDEETGLGDNPGDPSAITLDWPRFPLNEMVKRGWVRSVGAARAKAEELMKELIGSAGGMRAIPMPLCRRNDAMRQNAKTDTYALLAWCLKVLSLARSEKLAGTYRKGAVDLEFLSGLAKLSADAEGLRRVKETLSAVGVHLVCVAHLPKTYLDGAALRIIDDGAPVVALTLRYDRLDNFWFSLLHELAHVGRHFDGEVEAFVDDFSLRETPSRHEDSREDEADEWANEALIPEAAWEGSGLQSHASYAGIIAFSQRLGVHPAIVAGRIRHQTRNFRAFAPLLGAGEVRKQLEFAG
ncbi:MAG: ImmA/IrrE family metallo-endopeptidase [Bauldia sp.]